MIKAVKVKEVITKKPDIEEELTELQEPRKLSEQIDISINTRLGRGSLRELVEGLEDGVILSIDLEEVSDHGQKTKR